MPRPSVLALATALAAATCGGPASDGRRPAAEPARVAPAGEGSVAPAQESPVRVELISDTAIIQPGTMMTLGVRLTIAPGWHVHWKNPGAAGEPLSVDITLPRRFDAAPLRWPAPVRFTRPDGAVGYGYRDEVVLLSDVRPSNRDVDDGEIWPLRAEVSWMACARTCVPGRAALELSLPGSISGTRLVDLVNAPHVEAWASRMPVDGRSSASPFVTSVERGEGGSYVVSLSWTSAPADVDWFPSIDTMAAVGVGVVTFNDDGRTIRIVLIPPAYSAPAPDSLAGVVAYTTRTGERLAATLTVALCRPVEP